MPAPVMPQQPLRRHVLRFDSIENALQCSQVLAIVFPTLVGGPVEKCRRWELLAITRDDQLLTPHDRPDRIMGSDLGGFVKYDKIKSIQICRKILSHGEWAHHQARL